MSTLRWTFRLAAALLAFAPALWAQDAAAPRPGRSSRPIYLAMDLSDQDKLVYVTSIEWGSPDRWSFTSRYIHMFDTDRDTKEWLNNFTASLSPGTGGGRLGIGYQCLSKTKGRMERFGEARVVFLRTWGNPLQTAPNRSFLGAELRGSVSFLCNVGVGYYRGVSSLGGAREAFWGVHVGFGL